MRANLLDHEAHGYLAAVFAAGQFAKFGRINREPGCCAPLHDVDLPLANQGCRRLSPFQNTRNTHNTISKLVASISSCIAHSAKATMLTRSYRLEEHEVAATDQAFNAVNNFLYTHSST